MCGAINTKIYKMRNKTSCEKSAILCTLGTSRTKFARKVVKAKSLAKRAKQACFDSDNKTMC
jgi:hypothetical protein